MKKNLISIVVPCYNEEEAIPLYYEAMQKQMTKMDYVDFEIIFVNDGSKDKTKQICEEHGFNLVSLPRNNAHLS